MKPWYEAYFENYANNYEKEDYTQGTKGECDFIEQEMNFEKSIHLLDLGCGTGRHSIELTARGYKVTGIDLSDNQLNKAKEDAALKGLSIEFIKADARTLNFENQFEAVLMLCEGAFPLMETDEMNYQILKNASKALKAKGKFIFTTLNGLFPLYHSVTDFVNDSGPGNSSYVKSSFDLMTFRDYSTMTFKDDSGVEHTIDCNERYYVPSEITWLLKSLGFDKIDIYVATIGKYSRNDKLTINDFEMLVIAEKA